MRTTAIFIVCLHLLTPLTLLAQSPFAGKVKIRSYQNVVRIDKVPVTEKAEKGDKITKTWTTKENGKSVEVVRETTVTDESTSLPPYMKTKKVSMLGLTGYVSLSPEKDKPNTIRVNYWLNSLNEVDSGIRIKVIKRYWKNWSDAEQNIISVKTERDEILKELEQFRLTKVKLPKKRKANKTIKTRVYQDEDDTDKEVEIPGDPTQTNWFKYAKTVIEVYKKSDPTELDYYLVDKYGREDKYVIELPNRRVFSFVATNWDLGAITMPFKVQFGYRKQGIRVQDQIIADYNIGVFGGWSVGREKYRYETGDLKRLYGVKATFGLMAGIAKQDLDSLSTTTAEFPLATDEKRSMMVVSFGAGVMFSINDIKLGAFIGTDLGTGASSAKWNFHGRPWFGVGLGYNLAALSVGKKD